MILSTTTSDLFHSFGYERGIELAAELGFDALDFNMYDLTEEEWVNEFSEEEYLFTCSRLKEMAGQKGLTFNQAHAPFPSYDFKDSKNSELRMERTIRSIRIAGLLGASQIVVHSVLCPESVNQKQFNMDFYRSLIPYCKENHIRIALENICDFGKEKDKALPSGISFAKELLDWYKELPEEYFTLCLDVGHSVLVGEEPGAAIRSLGQSLGALHIHDNDGKSDQHTLPYQGILDWEDIMQALKEIRYQGDFTFEVEGRFIKNYAHKPELLEEAFRMMVLTGRELLNKLG